MVSHIGKDSNHKLPQLIYFILLRKVHFYVNKMDDYRFFFHPIVIFLRLYVR